MEEKILNSHFSKELTVKEFNKSYYEEHKDAGLDYLGHGYWQESYARMVVDATCQYMYNNPFFLDIGCACGSILYGFKKLNLFSRVLGVDLNAHMVALGKKTFSFQDDELICRSASDIPLEDKSITLVHSAQVFEHIPENNIDGIIKEMWRVMRDDGRAFIALDAVRIDENVEMYMGDPTHVTLKSPDFWSNLFMENGFYFDVESYDRYARAPHGPTKGIEESFFSAYHWSVWVLKKR